MKRSVLVWRSAAPFVLTGLVATFLHELGHALAGRALGGHPVLFPSYVLPDPHITPRGYAVMAAAGPLASALLAVLGVLGYRAAREEHTDARLAALWLVFHGFIDSAGYLLLTPFSRNDLGGIAYVFGLPPLARWALFGLGVFLMARISRVLQPALESLAPSPEHLATPEARAGYARDVALIPWAMGVVCSLTALLPIQTAWSLAPLLASGIPLVGMYFDARKAGAAVSAGRPWRAGMPWPALGALVLFWAFLRFVVQRGLAL